MKPLCQRVSEPLGSQNKCGSKTHAFGSSPCRAGWLIKIIQIIKISHGCVGSEACLKHDILLECCVKVSTAMWALNVTNGKMDVKVHLLLPVAW